MKKLNQEYALYCYQLMRTIIHEEEDTDEEKIADLNDVYDRLLRMLTKDEAILLPNTYHRAIFVFENYKVPTAITKLLKKFSMAVKKNSKDEIFVKKN